MSNIKVGTKVVITDSVSFYCGCVGHVKFFSNDGTVACVEVPSGTGSGDVSMALNVQNDLTKWEDIR